MDIEIIANYKFVKNGYWNYSITIFFYTTNLYKFI